MTRGGLITSLCLAVSLALPGTVNSQQQPPLATFAAGVDLVRMSVVVRDQKGRVIKDLTANDFVILDAGEPTPISDFRTDAAGISAAFLFDVSGSMEGQAESAREAAQHVLSWLDPAMDESAVFTFDTELQQLAPFKAGMRALPAQLAGMKPFGATSLHDAIAWTAEQLDTREGRRRAVIVFTDGRDNASHLTPTEVSGIASSIDVPVYVVGVVSAIDDPATDIGATAGRSTFEGTLLNLASWTGGGVFVASSPGERNRVAQRIVEELRHQYLVAFESSTVPGWHPLVVRARNKDYLVRARGGYIAGQSRPISQ